MPKIRKGKITATLHAICVYTMHKQTFRGTARISRQVVNACRMVHFCGM